MHIGEKEKKRFIAMSEKLSVNDIATKTKFVIEGGSAGMDSSTQLAVEMI